MIEKLGQNHLKHLQLYGSTRDNERRPSSTGASPSQVGPTNTAGGGGGQSAHDFTYGVANRAASVRIPRLVADEGKGHLQDRRPPSNADPYKVAECISRAACTCVEQSSFPKVDSIQTTSLVM